MQLLWVLLVCDLILAMYKNTYSMSIIPAVEESEAQRVKNVSKVTQLMVESEPEHRCLAPHLY